MLLALALASCAPRVRTAPSEPPLVPLARVPAVTDDGDLASLAAAARESIRYYERLPADRPLAFGADRVTAGAMRASLTSLLAFLATGPTPDALAAELDRRFVAYEARAPNGVLFTGYYLPLVEARRERDPRFRVPLLGRPPDLVTVRLDDFARAGADACACRDQVAGRVRNGRLEPYLTRAEITRGAVAAPVLAWLDDPVALFFLQIQGSGTLVFPDGRRQVVGFDASNGYPYVSIGKLLVDSGRLPAAEASMEGITRWAATHPDEIDGVLDANPRYVFFRRLDGSAVGSIGVPVTGGRTIATDPTAYPPGALALVRLPGTEGGAPAGGVARLVLNQDTGAAIRGPGRVDFLVGSGPEAGMVAGRLKAYGELYWLVPRPGTAR